MTLRKRDTIADQAFLLRRRAIFDAGAEAARSEGEIKVVFQGRELGSLESITFISGVVSVLPDFPHSWSGLVNPRRP